MVLNISNNFFKNLETLKCRRLRSEQFSIIVGLNQHYYHGPLPLPQCPFPPQLGLASRRNRNPHTFPHNVQFCFVHKCESTLIRSSIETIENSINRGRSHSTGVKVFAFHEVAQS